MPSRRRSAVVPVVSVLAALVATAGAVQACSSNGDFTTLIQPHVDGSTPDQTSPVVTVDAGTDADTDASDDAANDWLAPPPITRSQGDGDLGALRKACTFEAGAWPAQTIGTEYPVGKDIPINHVIVIVQENRSFDDYFGRLVAQGYYAGGDFSAADAGATDGGASDAGDDAGATATVDSGLGAPGSGFLRSDAVDDPPAGWSNPMADGGLVYPHPDDEYCYGSGHSWGAMHDDYDDGKLDHFVTQNDPDGQRIMFYEDDTVIPFYYALANTFAMGDRYFCSVLSSTWPNRYFLMAGTSFGIGDNSFCGLDTQAHPVPQIFGLLEQAGRTWMDYTDGPHMLEFFPYFGLNVDTVAHYGNVECDMLNAIKTGTLPDVSFMMGDEVTQQSDEGGSIPGIGGQLTETILRTLFASPSWKDTAVFLTYDENGGMADHVPPAPACEPDGYTPHDGNNNPLTPGKFDTTGFRVPFMVVSPYARKHFVSHVVHDHTSITRFIEARFGLPAMTGRDANAAPPMEMFDFANPPFLTPPTISATTPVDPTQLANCKESLAPLTCGSDGG